MVGILCADYGNVCQAWTRKQFFRGGEGLYVGRTIRTHSLNALRAWVRNSDEPKAIGSFCGETAISKGSATATDGGKSKGGRGVHTT